MPILIRPDLGPDPQKDRFIGQELAGKETYYTYLIRLSASGHRPNPDV